MVMWRFIGLFLMVILVFLNVAGPTVSASDSERTASAAASDEDDIMSEDATLDSGEDKSSESTTADTPAVTTTEGSKKDAGTDGRPGPSTEASATVMFTNPSLGVRTVGAGLELPVNKKVEILVSFTNDHPEGAENKEFVVEALDAAFRYPQDFSYYVQNFTTSRLSRTVEPQREASFSYQFLPSIQLAGRPFGLTIRLGYRDQNHNVYNHFVFNDTVLMIDNDEGFDTEAFFMWVLIAALFVLGLFGLYHLAQTYGYGLKKFKRAAGVGGSGAGYGKTANGGSGMEMGTRGGKMADVDYDWIPSDHLKMRQSPSMSPRKRKTRRDDGSASN